MAEPRFRTLAPAEWSPAQARLAQALTQGPRGSVRGPYEALIYSPELADRMRHLGDFIRFEGALPPRLKELLVFTVARRWSVDFMFAVHRAMTAAHGIEDATVDAIARGEKPSSLAAPEEAACDAARELLRDARLGDATFATLRRHFDESAIIELITFVGYYTTLAMVLNTAQVAPPAGAATLPPLAR